jgi:hypothetical protein
MARMCHLGKAEEMQNEWDKNIHGGNPNTEGYNNLKHAHKKLKKKEFVLYL